MRERVDDDYTDFYYNQGSSDVDILKYWGGLDVENGSDTAWINLYDYMKTRDLSIAANYQHVADRFELMSLIDNFILNTYVVNTDWLNWNTSWWRGRKGAGKKWRYSLWDEDNVFNLGQNFTGVATTTYDNDPCNVESLPQFTNAGPNEGHVDMLRWLFANSDFKNLYLVRYADLANTTLRCDTMIAILDRLTNRLAPEMPNQTARWGGSVATWNSHLDLLRDQINGRCAVISQGLVDCYTLTGPYPIVVQVQPVGAGTVRLNTLDLANYPWSGTYYGNTTLEFTATTTSAYVFDHWEVKKNVLAGAATDVRVKLPITNADTVTAVFRTILSAGADVTICAGQSATLMASGASGYQWKDFAGVALGGGSSLTISPVATAKYVVTTPVGADTVQVFVTPLPVYSLGKDTLICKTGSITIAASVAGAGTVWQDGTTSNAYTATGPGIYYATVTVSGCSFTDTLNMGLAPSAIFSVGPDVPLCNGNSVLLTAPSPFGPPRWQNGLVSVDFTTTTIGTYHASLDRYGCTYRDTVNVVAAAPVEVTLGPDRILCPEKGAVTLYPQIKGGATSSMTVTWQDGSMLSAFQARTAGTYSVSVNKDGCTGTASVKVTDDLLYEYEKAAAGTICQGDTLLIEIPFAGISYQWDQDSLKDMPLTITRDGRYGVTLSHGTCRLRDAFVYTTDDCPRCVIYPPNAITPNGDGVNDRFTFESACKISSWELHIYDRWGKEIFSSFDPAVTWGAEDQPEGAYMYRLTGSLIGEWDKPVQLARTGSIVVIY